MVRVLTSLAFRRSRFFRAAASEFRRSSCPPAVSGGIVLGESATYLVLDLLFLVHLLGDLDSFSELFREFGFYIQPELGENGEEPWCGSTALRCQYTSSRSAVRHLMRVLKSPFPRTFRSSQFVRTSGVVRSRLRHLEQTLVMQVQGETRNKRTPSPRLL